VSSPWKRATHADDWTGLNKKKIEANLHLPQGMAPLPLRFRIDQVMHRLNLGEVHFLVQKGSLVEGKME